VARALALGAFSLAVAAAVLPVARSIPSFVASDDGYFYAQIAYQLGTTGRSTFDGLHTTSGYHLPWGLLLGALSRVVAVVTLDRGAHLFAYLAASSALISWTTQRFFVTPVARAAAFVFLWTGLSLTEMTIAVPLLLLLMERVTRDDFGHRRADWVLAAALPIVRVDLTIVVLAVALLTARRRTSAAIALGGATIAGALLQLATMKLCFGHFVSVAALLKSDGVGSWERWVDDARLNSIGSPGQLSTVDTTVALAALALAPRRDGSRTPPGANARVIAPLAFLAVHFVASVLRDWYWVPSQLCLLFAAEQRFREGDEIALPRGALATIAALASVQLARAAHIQVAYAADAQNISAFVREIEARVPASEPIFQTDGAGYVGFFSGREVIDGDGLVGDLDYATRLRRGRLATYLDDEKVCYLVTHSASSDPIIDQGGLVVRRPEVELLTSVKRSAYLWGDFALYRMRRPSCRGGP
jgi:hypothetical protein